MKYKKLTLKRILAWEIICCTSIPFFPVFVSSCISGMRGCSNFLFSYYSSLLFLSLHSKTNRTKSNQRWMKLRTTVQISSAIQSKKPPLKREDSFLKRFSTRQIPETQVRARYFAFFNDFRVKHTCLVRKIGNSRRYRF